MKSVGLISFLKPLENEKRTLCYSFLNFFTEARKMKNRKQIPCGSFFNFYFFRKIEKTRNELIFCLICKQKPLNVVTFLKIYLETG